MIKKLLAASIIAGSMITGASNAGDVADLCTAIVDDMGMSDDNGGCTCFEDSISDEEKEIYLSLESEADWEARATDNMKESIAACFPAP